MDTQTLNHRTTPKLVTVFGGSGFVGRHVVDALARRGYRVRVAVRKPEIAYYMQPLGNVGQIQLVQANIRHRWSVERAVQGADYVVNLVGILSEGGKQRFNTVHAIGAKHVAEATAAAGLPLLHMSALGADLKSAAEYARTKAEAERQVLSVKPDAIILRPSVIFGPEDQFFNKFASMSRFSPFMPLIGGGKTQFQPVYVGDVAEVIARSVEGKLQAGKVYELGGAEVLTLRRCMEISLEVIGRKRAFINLPWWVAGLQGKILGLLPNPPLTSDQVKLLKSNNVVSQEAADAGLTLEGLGIKPQAIDAILPSYLWRYRALGQYDKASLAR
ncbi:complex I NDUFA9 subunit family protein [Pseudochrobactrum sp. sp1633]|uniref:complex I NDUFA9 subunit family protein n=1 Tax=Pseudochrobactrum sp. sp1633 TaxID=3036706 RepID=UPI0025A58E37|nr:complex I NDUFA9 subunit family protein [Pseudochrobactrum sp. sp1633]MDM8345944.1 complex I NDUFA9 subunit family protein [Pseudochrobactrum sp. sp1633]HWD12193.1 complex I NDUFA9 subunit family protein [Pseudochrobactrum sp.]